MRTRSSSAHAHLSMLDSSEVLGFLVLFVFQPFCKALYSNMHSSIDFLPSLCFISYFSSKGMKDGLSGSVVRHHGRSLQSHPSRRAKHSDYRKRKYVPVPGSAEFIGFCWSMGDGADHFVPAKLLIDFFLLGNRPLHQKPFYCAFR